MAVEYEVNAKVGVDKNDKPVYRKIGVVIETKNGLMLKLEVIPVIGWDGWAYMHHPEQKSAPQQQQRPQRQQRSSANFDDLDDDIPF